MGRRGHESSTARVGGALLTGMLAVGLVTACDDSEGGDLDAAQLDAAVDAAMENYGLRSMLMRVTVDGEPQYEVARGESMSGVPATLDMHFRNGAFGFTLMSTLLMKLVDDDEVALDDPLSTWFPDLPHAAEISVQDIAQMTSGYADYVYQPEMLEGFSLNPYRQWTSDELIEIGTSKPMDFEPGTNWGYSHTNYVILGRVLEDVTGMELGEALRRFVLVPMKTTGTTTSLTPAIPDPVLHTFSSERREALEIPNDLPFYEDSTFWDPSWTTAPGAVGTSRIADLTTIMEAVGTGALLSEESFRVQTAPNLIGFGHPDPNCSVCRENTEQFNYGLGVLNVGPWLLQSKGFGASDAAAGYLADGEIAVAIQLTYRSEAFDDEGGHTEASSDASRRVFADITSIVAPDTFPAAG